MPDSPQQPPEANASVEARAELPKHLLRKLKITLPGYKLGKLIARGGQAIVIKAVQESTGKDVAIKLLREGPLADMAARARLQREISVLAALNHPNIVTVLDHGVTPEGLDYLVMNFVEGQPLNEFISDNQISENSSLDPAALLKLFSKLCSAMNAAHLRGIVHRDLSPSNIMIDLGGEPHILDFGLARTAFDRMIGGGGRTISITGQFMGKVAYASPEQARGEHDKVDIRTDVYALGVILYQILTGGEFPYKVVGNVIEVLGNIVNEPPTPPSKQIAAREAQKTQSQRRLRKQHPPSVNEAMEAIVLKSLEKDPANRYQSAGEFGRDIENYLAGLPTIAQVKKSRYGFPTRPPSGEPRKTWLQPPEKFSLANSLAKLNRTHVAIAGLIGAVLLAGWAIFHFLNAESPAPDTFAQTTASDLPATIEAASGPNASPVPQPTVIASLPQGASSGPGLSNNPSATGNAPDNTLSAEQESQLIDLLAKVDLAKDVLKGKWTKTPGGLESDEDRGKLLLGYPPAEEYDFKITFTPKSQEDSNPYHILVTQLMPAGKDFHAWAIARNDSWFFGAPPTGSGISIGEKHTSLVKVRRGSISAYLDDKLVTLINRSALKPATSNEETPPGMLALGALETPTIFHSIEVTPINSAAVSSTPETPSASIPIKQTSSQHSLGKPINLLANVDLAKDALKGKWTKDDQGIQSDDSWTQLQLGPPPTEEYDFSITFTCLSEKNAETQDHRVLAQVLSSHGTDFGWVMGDGDSWFAQGPHASSNQPLPIGTKHLSVVKVRRDSVSAYLDGVLASSKKDYSNLTHVAGAGGIPSGMLALMTFHTPTIFHSIEVTPVNRAVTQAPPGTTNNSQTDEKSPSPNAADALQVGSVWSGVGPGGKTAVTLMVTERNGNIFKGKIQALRGTLEIEGTVDGENISWNTQQINAKPGRTGAMMKDGQSSGTIQGDEISITQDPNGGEYWLRRKD